MQMTQENPLDAYFRLLDDGEFDACAALFAEDALYIRPGKLTADSLVVTKGRPAILEFFRKRGKLPHRHRILKAVSDGNSCFVEGRGGGNEGGPFAPLHAFMSHGTFNADGLITRYFAVLTMPDEGGHISEDR